MRLYNVTIEDTKSEVIYSGQTENSSCVDAVREFARRVCPNKPLSDFKILTIQCIKRV